MKALLPDEHGTGIFSSRYMSKTRRTRRGGGGVRPRHACGDLASELLSRAIEEGFGDNYHTAVVKVIDPDEGS